MTREEDVNWMINISSDIGKVEHQELWHYEQALLKKAVVDAVKNAAVVVTWDDEADEYDVADIAIKATKRSVIESIEELPFAQPERKKGRWVYKVWDDETGIGNTFFCTECGKPQGQVYINYCAACGADMREEGEE